ncbi:MAG: pyridoxamine 5'-phosphate oxidase family protein [Bacteroidales bacterium]|nr:pyridoxamine 5'-phosphate oxidase family protein [Bacteroidales bacterium]MDD3663952.1 pyridoxamine 5'-phosphate oxidase family protein [Bacteroidales bacterium]
MDQRIVKFIKKHHLLSLATCRGAYPWSASCFYAWMDDEQAFVVTSDLTTRHGQEANDNPRVAGTIAWETQLVGRIQGIQFSGTMLPCNESNVEKAYKAYTKRFPIAKLMETHLWMIKPDHIKMTHNQLGFGTKLTWP